MSGIRLLLIIGLASLAAGPTAASNRSFEVRDAIEKVEADGNFDSAFSPDGKRFFVVTTRGDLVLDGYETSLWLFDAEAVARRLRENRSIEGLGQLLARRTARPHKHEYRFAIRSVRWLKDSRRLAYIATTPALPGAEEGAQLYVLDAATGIETPLTREPLPVMTFSIGERYALYTTESSDAAFAQAERNRRAQGLTLGDESLARALLPDYRHTDFMRTFDAFGLNLATQAKVRIDEPRYLQNQFLIGGWVSPTEPTALALRPAERVPPEWKGYTTRSDRDQRLWFSQSLGMDPEQPRRFRAVMFQFVSFDLREGSVRPLVDAPAGGWFNGVNVTALRVAWRGDGRSVVVFPTFLPLTEERLSVEERRERAAYVYAVEVDVDSGAVSIVHRVKPCASEADRCESVEAISWSDNDRSLVVSGTGADARSTQWVYRKRRDKWALSETSPVKESAAARDARLKLEMRQDLNTPPDVWVKDRAGHSARLIELNPQFKSIQLGRAEPITWQDERGKSWTGALLYPTHHQPGQRYPLVIQTHGYRAGQFLLNGPAGAAYAARALAARGLFVVQLQDLPQPTDLTPEEAPTYVRAYESLVASLDAQGLVQADKVGLIGWSRTCYHVKYALTHSKLKFAAATAADGVDFGYVGLLLFYNEPGWTYQTAVYDGRVPVGLDLARWLAAAPGFNVDRIDAPLRVETMTASMLIRDWEVYALMRMANKPVELVYFPEGSHLLTRPSEILASKEGNVDWYDFWLNRREDPSPAKAEQYERWRALREQQDAVLAQPRPPLQNWDATPVPVSDAEPTPN